ncbi:MAG: hypothetical protein LUE16_01860 [Lachnospiraceae bacterium]|nr:hypothetical protein [Lachnospiraceae bacterium]
MNSVSKDQTPAKEKAADLPSDPRQFPKANRTVKDSVFRDLFSDKKYLLMLYQTLHPEDKDCTEDNLTCVTLKQVMLQDIHNDLGFRAGDKFLVMLEAQSRWSVNIIVRSLMYIVRTYQDYIKESGQSLFSTKPVHIPLPEIYVVYTGSKAIEKELITLSEDFFNGIQSALEVRVKVLTGSDGDDIISQYTAFTHIINKQIQTYGQNRRAVTEAIRICMERDILYEYLERRQKEVVDIMDMLFDQDEALRDYIISERREVAEKVAKETEERVARETKERVARETATTMYQDRQPIKKIAGYFRTDTETVEKWLGLVPQA